MIGAVATAMVVTWKGVQWLTTQVERARKITALVAEYPLIVSEVTSLAHELAKVGDVLTGLVNRIDKIDARMFVAEQEHSTGRHSQATLERPSEYVEARPMVHLEP